MGFAEQGALLLAGVSGVQTQSSARGLMINAVAERDLFAAVTLVQAAIPSVSIGAVEVVYLDQGRMEPYVRVRVTVPPDHHGDVTAQLSQRRGLIESLDDTGGGMIVIATAPLAEMLGYDDAVSVTTEGRAIVDYEFVGYRPASRPPIPPSAPAGSTRI
jgi:translation elongation factor EF-G